MEISCIVLRSYIEVVVIRSTLYDFHRPPQTKCGHTVERVQRVKPSPQHRTRTRHVRTCLDAPTRRNYTKHGSRHNVGFLWLEAPTSRELPVAHFGSVRLESRTISDADALFRNSVPLASQGQGKGRLLMERRGEREGSQEKERERDGYH